MNSSTNNKIVRRFLATGLFSGVLLAAGCQQTVVQHQTTAVGEADGLHRSGESESVNKFLVAEEAAGARQDGMMYDYFFDGEYLNTLGQKKLELMIRSVDHVYPLVIYLNMPINDALTARSQAITAYLKDAGLVDGQFRFVNGPNPNASSPAAENLVRLGKTEDSSGLGGTTPVDQSNAGAPAAAPSGH